MIYNRLIVLALLLALAACTAPSTVMMNQDGQVARCEAHGGGLGGVILAGKIYDQCVDDMHRLGFVELPPVLLGIKAKDWAASPVVVSDVLNDTPAKLAGVQIGDTVTAVDGKPVATFRDFQTILSAKKPGDTLQMTLLRNGQQLDVSPVLVGR